MASAQQFALEYVQNGREPLERYLRQQSLVANKLGKLKIFSVKEVRKITSYKNRAFKTRVLLDLVISKGEVASYEFLKILYDTRNKTLPRANPSNQLGPDLHQWISCFSFKEDPDFETKPIPELPPCERYRSQLRTKTQDFFQAKWKRNMYFLKDKAKCKVFNYIPLVLDTNRSEMFKMKNKAYKKTRAKKMKTYIPVGHGNVSPANLLKNNESNILLVGKPGIGKTTVIEQMFHLLAEDEDHKGTYFYLFDETSMRSISHSSNISSLESLLFDKFLKPEEGTEGEVMQEIVGNSENVIVVFDGILDEISNVVIDGILQKELLPEAKIIATCRPEAEELLSDWPSFRVEVKGFTEESIRAFFRCMLDTENYNTCSVFNNFALFSLCHVPMYAFIVTACISFDPSETDHNPCTITEMYVRIFRHCMNTRVNLNVKSLDTFICNEMESIRSVALRSFEGMLDKTINLTGLCDKDNYVQRAFLTSSATKGSSPGFPFLSFLHNTMQEFWAALFLLMSPESITYTLDKCRDEEGKYLKHIILFLCGLLSSSVTELITCVVSEDQIQEICDEYVERILDTFLTPDQQNGRPGCDAEVDVVNIVFACQCLYEYQSAKACSLLLQKVNYELDLSGRHLDPQQCCALGYVINQSEDSKVWLCLDGSTFCSQGFKLILNALENVSHLRLNSVTCCQLWKAALQQEKQTNTNSLLRLCENKIHLNIKDHEDLRVLPRIREILMQRSEKITLCLHLGHHPILAAESLGKSIFDCLANIETISFFDVGDSAQGTAAWSLMVRLFRQDLLVHAALHQLHTGRRCVEDLLSALRLSTVGSAEDQSVFTLSLYQHIRKYEANRGTNVLPALRSVFQSTPAVWHLNLCERKAALLLEVLQLNEGKRPVEMSGSVHAESDLRDIVWCLPHISQLSCDEEVFISLCETLSVGPEMKAEASLHLIQALQHTISLSGWMTTHVCKAVANVLRWSKCSDRLDLTLIPGSISLQAAAKLLKPLKVLHKLRINETGVMCLARRAKLNPSLSAPKVQNLVLVLSSSYPKERLQCKVISCVAFLLRRWKVTTLDLRGCLLDSQCLTTLLCHQGPLTIRLSQESMELLAETVYETEDRELTTAFLEKIGRDLSDYTLEWNTLHYLLKETSHPVTVDLRKSCIKQTDVVQLLDVLRNVKLQRINSHFIKTILREIFVQRSGHFITSLLRSSDEWIDLSSLSLDHTDCQALRFALHYSVEVKLNLNSTVVPREELWNILLTLSLHRVTELRLDKRLLLDFLHTCAAQGEKANSVTAVLFRLLRYKLDFSHSATTNPTKQKEDQTPCISSRACRALAAAVCRHGDHVKLNLCDCQLEDAVLKELLPVLHKLHLRIGKRNLRRLLVLINGEDSDLSGRLAVSLSKALGDVVDLSQTPLGLAECQSLALLLQSSESISKLDLSGCSIGDKHLQCLIPHLHKVQVMNFSNNDITDEGAVKLKHYNVGKSFTDSDLLRDTTIRELPGLVTEEPFTELSSHVQLTEVSTDLALQPPERTTGKIDQIKTQRQIHHRIQPFRPTMTDNIYRYDFRCCGTYQCEDTDLWFDMKGPGSVEYSVDSWNRELFESPTWEPAGPLYDIRSPKGQLQQLHLPHCETEVYMAEDLRILHVRSGDEGEELVKPKMVSQSHVTARIGGLSRFQLRRRKQFRNRCIKGQVLFFLEPDVTETEQRLWIFLLPRNLPISQVQRHNSQYKFIKTCSNCILQPQAKYTLIPDLRSHFNVQPKKFKFENDNHPEQHATFELFLPSEVAKLRVKILKVGMMNKRWRTPVTCWSRRIILKACSEKRLTEDDWRMSLVALLENLTSKQLKKLKGILSNPGTRSGIPRSSLEGLEDPGEIAFLIVCTWGFQDSILAMDEFTRQIPRRDEMVRSLLRPYRDAVEQERLTVGPLPRDIGFD